MVYCTAQLPDRQRTALRMPGNSVDAQSSSTRPRKKTRAVNGPAVRETFAGLPYDSDLSMLQNDAGKYSKNIFLN